MNCFAPKKCLFFFIFPIVSLMSCNRSEPVNRFFFDKTLSTSPGWCIEGINELKKGDILVVSNGNYLPETTELDAGILFGHAALVTEGFAHENIDTLLSNVTIIELTGLHIHRQFQLREIKGLVHHEFAGLRSDSFGAKRTGVRYRLRLKIPNDQIDQIVDFARAQLGDDYCWNAMKRFQHDADTYDNSTYNWADNSVWNCTLLIWQAVYAVTSIDIDFNKGFFVYSNDMIAHPVFDNTENHTGRARF